MVEKDTLILEPAAGTSTIPLFGLPPAPFRESSQSWKASVMSTVM